MGDKNLSHAEGTTELGFFQRVVVRDPGKKKWVEK